MKTKANQYLAALLTALFACSPASRAAETNAAPLRIGVYDSRLLAYAHFWTDTHQHKLDEMAKAAKEAKAAGDTARVRELETKLKSDQEENHLQVFSTAPVDNVLAVMQDRVAEVQRTTGVARLICKRDEKALKEFKRAPQVDITDLLLREFQLSEKQRMVAEDMRKKRPLPPPKAQNLMREGKL